MRKAFSFFADLTFVSIAWDLLRIDVYGFKAFCKWFLGAYPTYFVSPLRISGSAVESLFSQYKHIAGGKLDSVNYTTARGAHLMKQIVSEHHSGADYRDQTISVAELGLKKKCTTKQIAVKRLNYFMRIVCKYV